MVNSNCSSTSSLSFKANGNAHPPSTRSKAKGVMQNNFFIQKNAKEMIDNEKSSCSNLHMEKTNSAKSGLIYVD